MLVIKNGEKKQTKTNDKTEKSRIKTAVMSCHSKSLQNNKCKKRKKLLPHH